MNKYTNKTLMRKIMNFFTSRNGYGLLVGCLIANFALAQSLPPPPLVSSRDEAGVDVISGDPVFNLQDLSIGNGISSLSHTISNGSWPYFWGFNDDYDIYVTSGGTFGDGRIAVVGHSSQLFDKSLVGAGYVAHNSDGATLILEKTNINVNGTDTNKYTYTKRDGTIAIYQYPVNTGTEVTAAGSRFHQLIYPNGYEVTVVHDSFGKKLSVLTNTGLQLKYINDHANDAPVGAKAAPSVSKIIAVNNAQEYCSPTAASCSLTKEWPAVNYVWPKYTDIFWPDNSGVTTTGPMAVKGYFKVTDALGRVTVYTLTPHATVFGNTISYTPRVAAVKDWAAAGVTGSATFTPQTTTYKYDNYKHCYSDGFTWHCNILKYGVVAEVNKGGAQWLYNYDQPTTQFVTVGKSTGPKGSHSATMIYNGDVNLAATGVSAFLTQVYTPDNTTVNFSANKENRPQNAVVKGKKFLYEYDSRGNLTKETQTSTADLPVGAVPKVANAVYQPCNVTNFKWCNKPTALIDAKSNQTDYVYGDEHGQVKSVTFPADKNGVRAQTRYKYSELYAWYKNELNVFVRATRPVWMLTEESTCFQGAASGDVCADTTKLVTTKYYYGPDSGPNNLWLRGVEKVSGGKTLLTCYQYDIYGNTIAETAPKAGLTSCP